MLISILSQVTSMVTSAASTPHNFAGFTGLNVNLTVLLSIVSISLAAMGTLIAIYGKKKPALPGESEACKQHKETIIRIESSSKEETMKIENLRNIVSELQRETAVLKNSSGNMEKNLDGIRVSVRDVAQRMEDLLQQLIEWMNHD